MGHQVTVTCRFSVSKENDEDQEVPFIVKGEKLLLSFNGLDEGALTEEMHQKQQNLRARCMQLR